MGSSIRWAAVGVCSSQRMAMSKGVYQRVYLSIGHWVTKRQCTANLINVGIVRVSTIPNPIGKIMAKLDSMARHENISQCVMSCYQP